MEATTKTPEELEQRVRELESQNAGLTAALDAAKGQIVQFAAHAELMRRARGRAMDPADVCLIADNEYDFAAPGFDPANPGSVLSKITVRRKDGMPFVSARGEVGGLEALIDSVLREHPHMGVNGALSGSALPSVGGGQSRQPGAETAGELAELQRQFDEAIKPGSNVPLARRIAIKRKIFKLSGKE